MKIEWRGTRDPSFHLFTIRATTTTSYGWDGRPYRPCYCPRYAAASILPAGPNPKTLSCFLHILLSSLHTLSNFSFTNSLMLLMPSQQRQLSCTLAVTDTYTSRPGAVLIQEGFDKNEGLVANFWAPGGGHRSPGLHRSSFQGPLNGNPSQL